MMQKSWFRVLILALMGASFTAILLVVQSRNPHEIVFEEDALRATIQLDASFVWFEQDCIAGHWEIDGDVHEVYFNGLWQNERAGNFSACQPSKIHPVLNFNRGADYVRNLDLPIAVIFPAPLLISLLLVIPVLLAWVFLRQDLRQRFWQVRYWLIILGVVSIIPLIRFAWINFTQPLDYAIANGEASASVQISQPALLFQEDCVQGHWAVEGASRQFIDTASLDFNEGDFEKCGGQADYLGLILVYETESDSGAIDLKFPVMYPNGLQLALAFLWLLSFYWIFGVQNFSKRQLAIGLGILHSAIAWLYIISQGFRIDALWTWDSLMHTLPLDLLRNNFWESMLYLHMQPPLLNVLGYGLDRIFGENMLVAMQVLFVLCGGVLVASSFLITEYLSKSRFLSIVVALLLALLPASFLYENIIIYTMPTSCLIVLSVYMLVRHHEKLQIRYLLLYIFILNVIILFRSLYHIVILLPAIILVLVLARHQWRRVLLFTLLISLLSFGWYAKNFIIFDKFASSTWLGNIWWKVVSYNYEYPELAALYEQGVLTENWLFDSESAYRLPSQFPDSFDKTSEIAVLANDDHNNINYPDIMDVFQANALRLIRHDPVHYLLNVRYAYGVYSLPPDAFWTGLEQLPYHRMAFNHYFYGTGLAETISAWFGWEKRDFAVGSMFYFYVMILGIGYPIYVLWRNRLSPSKWLAYLRSETIMGVMWGFIAYTSFMSIFFEMGENARYRYLTEHFQLIMLAVLLYYAGMWLYQAWKQGQSKLPSP